MPNSTSLKQSQMRESVPASLGSTLRWLIFAIAMVTIVAPKSEVAIAADAPLDTVKHLVTHVLAIVKDKQMAQSDKQKKLRDLAAANLDFDQMSHMVMGSAWKSLSAEQQRQFVPVFSSFLADSYINKVQNYSDQEIQITGSRMTEPNFAHVSGRVAQQGSEPIQLGFALKREGGAWKIYDIALDNVSTLHGYRVEFHRVLTQNGFDALMKQLQQRDRELASTLGNPTGLPF